MSRGFRVGLIVPSSNTTMEIELTELFRRRQQAAPERFSFHSARMRMTQVTPEALAAMDRESGRCADLVALSGSLDLARAEAIVLSACVQMPSLPAIPEVERRSGLPVLSAATATAHELLTGLGLQPMVQGAGYLLEGGTATMLR